MNGYAISFVGKGFVFVVKGLSLGKYEVNAFDK